EVDVLGVIAGRDLDAAAGGVVDAGHEVVADADTPVGGAAPEVLPAAPLVAVGLVDQVALAVPFPAVGVAVGAQGLDVQEGKAGPVADAVGAADDVDVADLAGVDLAHHRVEVEPRREPEGAVGEGEDLGEAVAADVRVGRGRVAALDLDARRGRRPAEQVADVGAGEADGLGAADRGGLARADVAAHPGGRRGGP